LDRFRWNSLCVDRNAPPLLDEFYSYLYENSMFYKGQASFK